jgi:hypothetical protein
MAKAACTHEGSTARLSCVTCEEPICPRCLVETRVGFKCQQHGRMGKVAPPLRATDPPKGKGDKGARPARRGLGLIWILVGVFVLFPLLTVGMGFLFASTGNSTGFVAFLPLLAVFVLLIAATWVVARKVLR